jgi:epoxyqueuosine reductase
MGFSEEVLGWALELGLDLAAIIGMRPPRRGEAYERWLAADYQGEMEYLAERVALRLNPARLAPDAQSIIVAVVNYNPPRLPASATDPSHGRAARYAVSQDYHDSIKQALLALDARIRERTGREMLGKVAVDTAPVLERDFAEQAGLGFIGRNTCLITPGLGSWTFLAALFVPETLETGQASKTAAPSRPGTCGACTRCLTACPTKAFVGDHVLDARRCISYLTIENRGPIPRHLRPLMGNWVFGCDICQEVCPYNRIAPPAGWTALATDPALAAIPLSELLQLDEEGFRRRFRGTPVRRTKRRGLVRNACVAAGNSGDRSLVPALIALLVDPEPLVRGHAAWALGRLSGWEAHVALRSALMRETDAYVAEELEVAVAEVEGSIA